MLIAYSSRSTFSPPHLRMTYLAKALEEKGVDVKLLNVPQSRLQYIKSLFKKVKAEEALFSVPPAYVPSFIKAKRLFADVRDPWDVYLSESGKLKRALGTFALRNYMKSLNKSEVIVATTKSIAEHYRNLIGKGVEVIPNGTDPKRLRCEKNFEGMVLVADFRNPYLPLEPLFEAVKGLEVPLRLIGPGSEAYGGMGPVNYYDLPRVACARVGIIPRPFKGKTYQMTIPQKAYDYMALGLCIFAYGPPGELQRLIEENGIGAYATKPNEVKEKLLECLEMREAGFKARELAEKVYDREKLSEEYAKLLLLHLASSRRS